MQTLLCRIRTVDNPRVVLPKAPGNPIRNPHPNRLIAIIYINFTLKTI